MPIPSPDVNRLVETYRSYAHAIAAEVLKKMPSSVERADLDGAAELGLVEAAQAFDPQRGVLFKTFAYYRVRGAVYDALRKGAWFSKSMYDQFRFEQNANEYMKDYSSAPNEAGSAEGLGQQLGSVTASLVSCYMLSLEGMTQEFAESKQSAEDELIADEQRERLRNAIPSLPEKNRKLIEDYYFKNRTLEEIGSDMGLSRSWVCRMHAKSLDMLRDAMQPPRKKTGGSTTSFITRR
jgi:RNA polymerase sigma factor for flagellar operon FliA